MGKPDAKQSKLSFETGGARRGARLLQEAGPSRSPPPNVAESVPHPPPPDFAQMMQEMRQGFATIVDKVDKISSRMDAVVQKLDVHEERLTAAEQRISDHDDTAATHTTQLARMDNILRVIAAKNEELEARSRRNNVRIIGVPESTNVGKMETYVERLLVGAIGTEVFSTQFIVERAHRTLGPRPAPGAAPRPIIARLLNYRDRDAALQAARTNRPLSFEGVSFTMYPDFTPMVQDQRRKFLGVKRKLRDLQVDYALLYPAKLRVTHQAKQHFFTNPQHAEDFAKRLQRERAAADRGGELDPEGEHSAAEEEVA